MASHLRVTQNLADEAPVAYTKFGITGDGIHFDHRGVKNLVDAVDNHGRVELGGNPVMLLGEPVILSDRSGLTITTDRTPNAEQRHASPCFIWDGVKGGDMLVLDRCRNLTIDGFVFETDDFWRERSEAGRAIVLDGGQDTHPGSHAFGTTCSIKRCRHVTYPDRSDKAPLDVSATFITIAERTKQNQEFHEITQCGGNGNGRGVFLHVGPSYNAKNIKLRGSRYIDAYQRGVFMENGSVKLEHNNMNFNEWDLYLNASTGYVTELGHIGEGSFHHAFINCPFYAYDGTYDISRTRPRSELIHDLWFARTHPDYHEYPECWIMFGLFAEDVCLERCYVGAPNAAEARVFGFMNDGSARRVELGPFRLGPGHTRRTLGIDRETLSGAPFPAGTVIFHDRSHEINPSGPGVLDLPTGELRFNDRGITIENSPYLKPIAPNVLTATKGPIPWESIGRGQYVIYSVGRKLRFQYVDVEGSRLEGLVGTGTVLMP